MNVKMVFIFYCSSDQSSLNSLDIKVASILTGKKGSPTNKKFETYAAPVASGGVQQGFFGTQTLPLLQTGYLENEF